MRAIITWKTHEEGGRKSLPHGTGTPPYAPQVRFTDVVEPWPPANAWSLVVEKCSELDGPFVWLADIEYLVETAPHHSLRVGRTFELYEGPKAVAFGRIVGGEPADQGAYVSRKATFSPELETLEQLCGGDLPLTVIRSLFPSDERFIAGISAMLRTGEVRLHLDGVDVPHWQWAHILSSPEARYQLKRRMG